jgi:hypothetical protein
MERPFARLSGAPPETALRPHRFPADFADSRALFDTWPGRPGVLILRARFTCDEPMRLAALLGYDGPVAAWLDGKRILRDPAGTNPAVPDSKSARFNATAGRHEITVALGDQAGRAWGVYLRLARTDVPRRQLECAPESIKMPRWNE